MKFIYYPLVLLWLSIFGQVVLWFEQAKYALYLSEGTSGLKRKCLALYIYSLTENKHKIWLIYFSKSLKKHVNYQ